MGKPAGRSTALQAERRGFNSHLLHHLQSRSNQVVSGRLGEVASDKAARSQADIWEHSSISSGCGYNHGVSELLDGSLFSPDQPCFGCGPANPHGLKLRFFRDGDAAVTRFTPGPLHQGPPGIMHGGLVTTVADELAGWTLILLRDKFGFTAEINAKLKRPIRIGAEVEGRGRIARDGRRIVRLACELSQGGTVAFTSELAFVLLDRGGAEQLLQQPLPDAWRHYCR